MCVGMAAYTPQYNIMNLLSKFHLRCSYTADGVEISSLFLENLEEMFLEH